MVPVEGDLRQSRPDGRRLSLLLGEVSVGRRNGSPLGGAAEGAAREGAQRQPGDFGRQVRRVPVEQVGKREHSRAAHQEHAAVQDGKAQPGGAARQARPAGRHDPKAWGGHHEPPMR